MRTCLLSTIGALALLFTSVLADEPSPAAMKREASALRKIARETLRLAKSCSTNGAYEEARSVLRKGLAVCPGEGELEGELERISGKEDEPRKGFAEKLAKIRIDSHLKCARWLADAARLFDKEGFPERFDRHVAIARRHFPSDEGMKAFGLVYFEPYRRWVRKADGKRLEKGGELLAGKWLTAKEVAALDERHRTWDDPWVIPDEMHELKTTASLRTALQLLHHIGAFREHFLSQFAGEWDLRPPAGKLPVILTKTREEMQARMKEVAPSIPPQAQRGAAFYFWTTDPLNPCFVTFEGLRTDGTIVHLRGDKIFGLLRHELTHQIAFELSKHSAGPGQRIGFHPWVVEGLANYMKVNELGRHGWRLAKPRTVPQGGGSERADFEWCRKNVVDLPPLEKLFAIPAGAFPTVDNYSMAATVTWFMLEGAGGRYRAPFLALAETIHQVRGGLDSLNECYAGVDLTKLQEEWETFVRRIELD